MVLSESPGQTANIGQQGAYNQELSGARLWSLKTLSVPERMSEM
jgi:hypothetical protein